MRAAEPSVVIFAEVDALLAVLEQIILAMGLLQCSRLVTGTRNSSRKSGSAAWEGNFRALKTDEKWDFNWITMDFIAAADHLRYKSLQCGLSQSQEFILNSPMINAQSRAENAQH